MEHLLCTKPIPDTGDSVVIKKDTVFLPGVHSLELEGEQKVRLHFHRRNAEGSFPFCISQCSSTLAEYVCICVMSSAVIKGSVVH